MKKIKVTIDCNACGATGLYSGFAEPRGVAVVCIKCGGTGKQDVVLTPFTRRHNRLGIKTVQRARGSFIGTGVGPTGGSITYDQFKNGKMPS